SHPYFCVAVQGEAKASVSGGNPPYTYSWLPGGQTNDTATGLALGAYTVTVTDSNGCSLSATVSVSSASVSFTASGLPTSIVIGDSTYLSAKCNVPATYSWAPSASITNPNSATSYATPTVTTTYTVTITTGCGTYIDSVTITVNCANLYNENICIVTIDTATNRDKIIWGRFNSPPDGFYNVYKENSSYAFSMIVSQRLDSLSDYIDTSSRPGQGPCTYELATQDSCGVSILSPPHTSIFLTDSTGVNVNILNWTGYVGFVPSQYIIYRGPRINSLLKIDSVPSSTLTYRDTLPPPSCVYLVAAINPSGPCVPSHSRLNASEQGAISFSNRRRIKNPTGIQVLNNGLSGLTLYPNPGYGVFTLGYSMLESGNIRITIVDELGQVVYNNTEEKSAGRVNEQLNLENLAAGIYSLRLQTNEGITVRKLVIIHNR
ncbi:MAG TPA: T9SS type A sorting domain-containing protein, partial [Bacteroidia bacterium]|nr:T9SS type A sorting domain-containing protein [Bacteroidia bacterium]